MRASTRKWAGAGIALILAAGAAAFAFFAGARYGRVYETYRFDYAANDREATRAALLNLIGRDKTYSQFGQDLWVTHGVLPGKRDGYYVDVGSADGVEISNTKLLDDMGWKGICIDPFPRNMSSRTCQVVSQPVFSESGKHVQFRKAGDLGGIEQDLNRHKEQISQYPEVEFVTATLDEILAKAHAPKWIDFMSMDVEGAEYDALRGLSFDRYQIGSLAIEHNFEPAKREAIHKLLASKGYVLVRSWSVDDWYVHRNLSGPYKDYISFCPTLTDCSY